MENIDQLNKVGENPLKKWLFKKNRNMVISSSKVLVIQMFETAICLLVIHTGT